MLEKISDDAGALFKLCEASFGVENIVMT